MNRLPYLEGDEVIFSETNQPISSRGKRRGTGQEGSPCSRASPFALATFPPALSFTSIQISSGEFNGITVTCTVTSCCQQCASPLAWQQQHQLRKLSFALPAAVFRMIFSCKHRSLFFLAESRTGNVVILIFEPAGGIKLVSQVFRYLFSSQSTRISPPQAKNPIGEVHSPKDEALPTNTLDLHHHPYEFLMLRVEHLCVK
jgi:hypothetical protein